MNYQYLAVAAMAVISLMVAFDFIIFNIKSVPKTASLTKNTWILGLFCMIGLAYWYLNGMKLF